MAVEQKPMLYFFFPSSDSPKLSWVWPGGRANPSTLWTRVQWNWHWEISLEHMKHHLTTTNERHGTGTRLFTTHASLNRTTTFCVGISAAFATSLLVIALIIAAATCFRTSGLALQALGLGWWKRKCVRHQAYQFEKEDGSDHDSLFHDTSPLEAMSRELRASSIDDAVYSGSKDLRRNEG